MKKNYLPLSFKILKNKSFKLALFLIVLATGLPEILFSQQTYTFTTAGATSSVGPTQLQLNSTYLSTNLTGQVVSVSGIQSWTVPSSGLYLIDASGAAGGDCPTNGNKLGGFGANMKGQFNLVSGGVVQILVGQRGENGCGNAGGGGGSYVVYNGTLLLAAGGGGGCSSDINGVAGATVTTGTQDNPAVSLGGTNGTGGQSCQSGSYNGGGGGGYLSGSTGNGTTGLLGGGGGSSFLNGGTGGAAYAASGCPAGGFGGGGGGRTCTVGGAGGGGYSGGAGGQHLNTCVSNSYRTGGGGGGSFNSAISQTNTIGANAGQGLVIIKGLCNITLNVAGINSQNAICSGSTVSLTTNAISNYSWSTGATTSSLALSPTVTTVYSLTATSPSNCTASSSFTVFVDPNIPVLTITNTANSGGICPSRTVALTASGATTYTWTGGTASVTNGIVFSPTSTSGYTVNGSNACGTSSAATSISIHPTPTVTAVASTASLCSGLNLTLTAVGNSTAYAWSGGPGVITNGVGFAPSATAIYTVIGTSALTCTAAATIPVTVVTTPINFPSQNTGIICIGGSSTLTATGATNYTWTSATQTVFTSTFVVTPNVGTTTYTVTKSNANCFDTKTISVVTNSLPGIFAIVNPTLVCAQNPATLSVGGGQTYTWTAPGSPNFTFTGSSPVVSPSFNSTYTVAASDGTCITISTISLATNPNPTIVATASSPSICYGQSVTLNATGGINYTWTATTGVFTTQTITDSPTGATAYNVIANNIYGCTSGANAVVLVNPNPTITIQVSKPVVCSGNPSTLTASGANSYTWDANANGALTAATVVNPTSPTSTIMTYTVQGSNSFPCQSSTIVQVSVFVPTLTVTGNTNTCYGGVIQLSASGGNNNSYSWLTSYTATPYPFSVLNATVTAPGVYTVNATTSSLSVLCPATKTVAVGVYYNPTITAVPQRTIICSKESVDLHGGGGVTYLWDNGSTGGTITVSPNGNTTYTVTGTDANGCVGTGTVLVKVSGCSGISELNNVNSGLVLYPNPNNGEFTIQANTDITLTLVNELGQVIKTLNLSGANNHKVSVNDLAKGIYFITGQKDNVQINQKVIVTK